MMKHPRVVQVEDYGQFVGLEKIELLRKKADSFQGSHVAHVNATYYGGGVAELLSSMTLLMSSLGIKTEWRTVRGYLDFFSVTKNIHNALQGGQIHITDREKQIYEEVIYENSVRNHLGHDFVIIHDPQPLPMIAHYNKKGFWIWRCHLDLSNPKKELWNYLVPFIEKYDTVILSMEEYAQQLMTPQFFFLPAIDPFSPKNQELSKDEMDERLAYYNIPTDLPLVVQISRFDRWKDPRGVIKAFELARKEVECTLVLLGNFATDDPEGKDEFESLLESQGERILILPFGDDTALVNALQRRAAVVLQKSIREGFGLTVTEAMWKGTPVIGGKVGGILSQIRNGENGFLVSSIEEAAERIVQLLRNKDLRERLGQKAKETVRERFLLTRLLEQYLDLFNYLTYAKLDNYRRVYKLYST